MDRGSEFSAHRINEDGSWDSEFKQYLESLGIRPIPTRTKHPQTKGKIEKWFDPYRRFRYEFAFLDNLSPGTMIDLMAIGISRIWNRRISHSGEDYLMRLFSVLVSEFLDGELMKNSRSYEQRSMRNTFGTVQTLEKIKCLKMQNYLILFLRNIANNFNCGSKILRQQNFIFTP